MRFVIMIFRIRVEVHEPAKKRSSIEAGINALAGLFGLSSKREHHPVSAADQIA